jgi:hypothetical protein
MPSRIPFPLQTALAGILAVMISGSLAPARAQSKGESEHPAGPLSPVILAYRPGAVRLMDADPVQVKEMVNSALFTLTSSHDVVTAWTRLGITPRDVVGIKITTVGGPGLSTHHAIVHTICDDLRALGVPSGQIIIWDKYPDHLRQGGYAVRPATATQAAIEAVIPNNFDPSVTYRNELAGNLIWGDYMFLQSVSYGGNVPDDVASLSYYTKLVTQTCTKLINVPVLSDDYYVGLHGCLSSMALGSVDNNRRFRGPPTYGDPAIDEILDKPFFRRKVVVHILDALVAQCAGGPKFNPIYCRSLGAIYVGRDPVAIDTLALRQLEGMRRALNVPPIGDMAAYVQDAPNYNLGTNDRRRIQFVRAP